MRFRRKNRERLLIGIFFVPFLGASLVMFTLTVALGLHGCRLAEHEGSALFGPTKMSGPVQAPRGLVRSPSGAEGAAWLAWIGEYRPTKNGRAFTVLCARAEIAGIEIDRHMESPARLDLVRPGDPVRVASDGKLPFDPFDVAVNVHFGGPEEDAGAISTRAPPEGMLVACQDALAEAQSRELLYGEQILAEGTAVEVLACAHAGDLSPCWDGVDTITVGTIAAMLRRDRSGLSMLLLFGQVWSLAILSTAGFAPLSLLLRDRRSPR